MTLRIVRREEVVQSLKEATTVTEARENALNELAALREWLDYPESKKREWGGNTYPRELIDEIIRELGYWPDPVTVEDLKEV